MVTVSTRDKQYLEKDLKYQFIGINKCKTKNENNNTTNECREFPESSFVGVNRLFVLIYSDQYVNSKRLKSQRYYLPKRNINYFSVMTSSMVKTFLTRPLILT